MGNLGNPAYRLSQDSPIVYYQVWMPYAAYYVTNKSNYKIMSIYKTCTPLSIL